MAISQPTHTPVAPGFPRIVDVGLSGMLINFSDVLSEGSNRAALAFRAELEARAISGVLETTTSLTSAFVLYDPLELPKDALRKKLDALLKDTAWDEKELPQDRRLWRIPAVFEGPFAPQLEEAADLAGVSPATAIEEICDTNLRVMTLGFAPGQPYLGSLPKNWDIPRQQGLTPRVPIGAITVAIRQIVLFATASPTGWRQVGRCAFHGFRPNSETPIALRPGDAIRFHPVTADKFADISAQDKSGNGGATTEPLT